MCVVSSPVSHSPCVRLDDEGFMSPSLLQLSNVVAKSVVLPWQHPRTGKKVVLFSVKSTHSASGCKSQAYACTQVVCW